MLVFTYQAIKKFPLHFLLLLSLITLFGCGGARSPQQSNFVPVRPDPTSTPDLASSPGQPTPVVSDQVAVSSYAHPSGRFGINYPDNWRFFERPDGVVFIDPSDQAGYSVFFYDVGEIYSEQELNQYLVTFVAKNFAQKETGFSPMGEEQQVNGAIVAQFASLDPNLGRAINEVRVSQQDTIIFVLLLSATETQWQASQNQLQALANTFTSLDTAPAVEAAPTTEPPVWVLTGPASNEFGFFYPSDWEILRQDESLITVAMPETDVRFTASNFIWPEVEDEAKEAAEKAALNYIETLRQEYKDVQHLPPAEFQLDTVADATTIDFLYTTQQGTAMAGSVITAASQGKIYQVVFTSSAEAYEAALQWFNPMYKSFKILPAEEIIEEP